MWTPACKVEEIPEGQAKAVSVDGQEVALFNVKGCFYALDNTCPHRGGPLGEGYLDGVEVTCPWHAWTFDVTTGICQTVPDTKQKTFKVKIQNNEVLLDL